MKKMKHGLYIRELPRIFKEETGQLEVLEKNLWAGVRERHGEGLGIARENELRFIVDAILRFHRRLLLFDYWLERKTKMCMSDQLKWLRLGAWLTGCRQREMAKLDLRGGGSVKDTGSFPSRLDPLGEEGDNASEEATSDE